MDKEREAHDSNIREIVKIGSPIQYREMAYSMVRRHSQFKTKHTMQTHSTIYRQHMTYLNRLPSFEKPLPLFILYICGEMCFNRWIYALISPVVRIIVHGDWWILAYCSITQLQLHIGSIKSLVIIKCIQVVLSNPENK